MADLTAKRTLVKSPPELWAELSELEGLARHLGEFGEIRITRVEPERTVAWEGESARGTVELEASGWGTKVTLTAAVPEARDRASRSEPEAAVPPSEVATAMPKPSLAVKPAQPPPPPPTPTPAPWPPSREPQTGPRPAPPARRGFLSRLLGRAERERDRPVMPRTQERPSHAEASAVKPPPQPQPIAHPVAAAAATAQPQPALDPEGALAVLEGVLDTLGSAHHRPFSRG